MIVTPYNRTHKVLGRVRNCISELESLAIAPKRLNELNDAYEMENLVDNIKLNTSSYQCSCFLEQAFISSKSFGVVASFDNILKYSINC